MSATTASNSQAPTHANRYTRRKINPSFHTHSRAQEDITPINEYGCTGPGEQNPSSRYVMAEDFFVSDKTWKDLVGREDFDYIVIGSGHTGYAFVSEALKRNPLANCLMLERGEFWLPTHFQNLSLPFKYTLGGPSETFPWTLSQETCKNEIKYLHGSCPFFGGRSTFWSAWSPSPIPELMRRFPKKLKKLAMDEINFWDPAKKLLNVISAGEIEDQIYDKLQKQLKERLENNASKVQTARSVQHAPLSVRKANSTVRFDKFSTPGPILALYEDQQNKLITTPEDHYPFLIADHCIVTKLEADDKGNVVKLNCIRDDKEYSLPTENAKIILCMGAIPATTLLLNSFPEKVPEAGKRLAGHFLTHIVARIPKSSFKHLPDKLQIAAIYLDGGIYRNDEYHQYHIQITGICSPYPADEAVDAARECPDYAASATPEQLKNSENYVVLVCASLGELDELNQDNFVKLNKDYKGQDTTCNILLQILPNKNDLDLWSQMDNATYQAIEAMATNDDGTDINIEYWHEKHGWKRDRPPTGEIHIPGIVHETSTLRMDQEEGDGVIDWEYRPHGIKNAYVTGGAIFPSAGSWNPTLTMCGFAQDLARQVVEERN